MSEKKQPLTKGRIVYSADSEGRPIGKKVLFSKHRNIRPDLTAEEKNDLFDLQTAIEAGQELPDRFYRKGLGQRGDELLVKHGVMHLHLGGQDSDTIVYLMQFESHVLILDVSDHRYLDETPPGKSLYPKTRRASEDLSDAIAAAAAEHQQAEQAKSERQENIRRGLLPRKPRPPNS